MSQSPEGTQQPRRSERQHGVHESTLSHGQVYVGILVSSTPRFGKGALTHPYGRHRFGNAPICLGRSSFGCNPNKGLGRCSFGCNSNKATLNMCRKELRNAKFPQLRHTTGSALKLPKGRVGSLEYLLPAVAWGLPTGRGANPNLFGNGVLHGVGQNNYWQTRAEI